MAPSAGYGSAALGLYAPDGRVIAMEGIIQDISSRESTYRALRNAERRYRSLFDNAIEGIFRTSPDGRYLDANPALARIYGFDSPLELMNSLSRHRGAAVRRPEPAPGLHRGHPAASLGQRLRVAGAPPRWPADLDLRERPRRA